MIERVSQADVNEMLVMMEESDILQFTKTKVKQVKLKCEVSELEQALATKFQ